VTLAPDPAWGRTTVFEAEPPGPDDDDQWPLPPWVWLVEPGEDGNVHHGSRGSTLPDTVVVGHAGAIVALADPYADVLANQYCEDTEYYLVLRLREILDPAAWRALPWAHLDAGDVFAAWDKFHGHEYSRTAGSEQVMSYGGDWNDLQSLVDQEWPGPRSPRPIAKICDATLLRAIRNHDEPRALALVAAGADPNAGASVPFEAIRSVSWDRDTTALWEAIVWGSLPVVQALLEAGASVQARQPDHMTPLNGALVSQKPHLVPVLLLHGSDPDAAWQGLSARQRASYMGIDVDALLSSRP
jgi:hypothetical protein